MTTTAATAHVAPMKRIVAPTKDFQLKLNNITSTELNDHSEVTEVRPGPEGQNESDTSELEGLVLHVTNGPENRCDGGHKVTNGDAHVVTEECHEKKCENELVSNGTGSTTTSLFSPIKDPDNLDLLAKLEAANRLV